MKVCYSGSTQEEISARGLWSLPHLHCCIIARGGDAGAVGRPGYGIYAAGMPAINADKAACSGMPDLHNLVGACGGDAGAVR